MVQALKESLEICECMMVGEITIRYMNSEDLSRVYAWRNDPRIRNFMLNSNEISLHQHAAWFETACTDPLRHLLLVCELDIPFGFVQLGLDDARKKADWGFYTNPDGPKGQGSLLGRSVLDFAFSTLKLERIFAQVLAFNIRSIIFHQRLGFVEEGILRSHHFTDNGYQDVHLFGLMAGEYREKTTFSIPNKVKCEGKNE